MPIKTAYNLVSAALTAEKEALDTGLSRLGYVVRENPPDSISCNDVFVMWNRWKHNDSLARRAESAGARVIVAENGYIGKTVALSLSEHNGGGRWPEGGPERFDALGVDLANPKPAGDFILLCPSRGMGSIRMKQPINWFQDVLPKLSEFGAVKVRQHPGNWKLCPPKVTLQEDLQGAYGCAIWNSAAGVHALIAGYPVFCFADYWICKAAASDLQNPSIDGRYAALVRLAWAQWTLDEIRTGDAIKRVLEC